MSRPARRPGALLGLGAVLAGAVGVAIGLGIGLPWLAKDGVSVVSVAALAALLGGLVLVAAGAVAVVRRVPGWWRLLAVPALLVLAVLVVYPVGIALAATVVAPTAVGDRTPADVGLAYEDVRVTAADGVVLAGWYVPADGGAAVVLRHGAGSTRTAVLDHAVVLARAGYGVLMLDARGHGDSTGRAMDFGWYGDADITAAVSALAKRPDVDEGRIAVVGLSMGGEEAIGAGAADPRVAAVVAEGATNRTAADKAWLPEEYGLQGRLQVGLDRLTYGLADLLTPASPPTPLRDAVVAMAPRPVLLVAGGAVPDEVDTAERLAAAAPDRVVVWVAPGSGHVRALDDHPEEWAAQVTGFLDTAFATASAVR
ncbi:MAG: alpha/beta fold hydrolase [Actinomycetia bacterium]|nr:alpha/beta fold hydrolase [Actinomycetes bacterium]